MQLDSLQMLAVGGRYSLIHTREVSPMELQRRLPLWRNLQIRRHPIRMTLMARNIHKPLVTSRPGPTISIERRPQPRKDFGHVTSVCLQCKIFKCHFLCHFNGNVFFLLPQTAIKVNQNQNC